MKKLISVCLALALMLNILVIPASAASSMEEDTEKSEVSAETFLVRENADGTYTMVAPDVNSEEGSCQVSNISNADETLIPAVSVFGGDILCLPSGQYLSQAYDSTYVSATRIELNTEEFDENYPVFEEYGVDEEVIQSAKETIESQQEIGNSDFSYAIYITDEFVPRTGDAVMATTSDAVSETIEEVRDYVSPWRDVVKGTSAKSVAASLTSIFVSVVSLTNSTVTTASSIFSTGLTALAEYQKYVNKTIDIGKPDDWQQVRMKYDWLLKNSYLNTESHGKQLGCVSQKLWLNRIYYGQYFVAGGKEYITSNYLNSTYKTAHWDTSQKTALYNYTSPIRDSNIKVKVAGNTYTFGSVFS